MKPELLLRRFLATCKEMMDNGLSKSRFIALLFARHISFTHRSDPSARPYLTSLKKLEKQWIKESGSSKAEIDSAYALLEFYDAFSLLICQNQIPPQERRPEISIGPSGTSFQFFQQQEPLIVMPWPFEPDSFEVSYERLVLTQINFQRDKVFREALRKAKVKLCKVMISRH